MINDDLCILQNTPIGNGQTLNSIMQGLVVLRLLLKIIKFSDLFIFKQGEVYSDKYDLIEVRVTFHHKRQMSDDHIFKA